MARKGASQREMCKVFVLTLRCEPSRIVNAIELGAFTNCQDIDWLARLRDAMSYQGGQVCAFFFPDRDSQTRQRGCNFYRGVGTILGRFK